jgi:uncharacterized protein YndB with AHSA1/START domain
MTAPRYSRDAVSEAETTAVGAVRSIRLPRTLAAPPDRTYRAWADPEAIRGWFAEVVEGSLAVATRSVLVWPDRRAWIDVLEAEPERRFRFRWGLLPHDPFPSEVLVALGPRGYGTQLLLETGPFDLAVPGALDAYAAALEGWTDALANLRAQLDFAVDLRRR